MFFENKKENILLTNGPTKNICSGYAIIKFLQYNVMNVHNTLSFIKCNEIMVNKLINPTIINTVNVWINNVMNTLLSFLGLSILNVDFIAIGLAIK